MDLLKLTAKLNLIPLVGYLVIFAGALALFADFRVHVAINMLNLMILLPLVYITSLPVSYLATKYILNKNNCSISRATLVIVGLQMLCTVFWLLLLVILLFCNAPIAHKYTVTEWLLRLSAFIVCNIVLIPLFALVYPLYFKKWIFPSLSKNA